MMKAWVTRDTGVVRIFYEGEELEGYSTETHDLIDAPDDIFRGNWSWDVGAREWTPSIMRQQHSKWSAVKQLRDVKADKAPTPFGIVDSDDSSKIKITGLVSMAMLAKGAGAAFSEEFTMADNSVVTMDADMVIGLGVAVGQHISAVYARARALREDIDAATTQAELDAIDIETGWPT